MKTPKFSLHLNTFVVNIGKFIFAIELAQFGQILQATLSEGLPEKIKENDFAHKPIIPIEKICSYIPKDSLVTSFVREKSECFKSVPHDEQKIQQDARTIENLNGYIHQ